MSIKEDLLSGLKPVLAAQIKTDLESGRFKQPVDFKATSDNVWRALRTNLQTAGGILVFSIKREEIDKLLREVFVELKVVVR